MARKLKTLSYYDKARIENDAHYRYFLTRAQSLYAAQREWKGMGDYFSAEFAESCLFYQGWVTIWYDPIVQSFLCGKIMPGTSLDIYGNFTSWTVQTINGMHVNLSVNDAVIVYDSSARNFAGNNIARPIPPVSQIIHVVDEMCALYKSLKVNISSLGCPLIISGSQQQQLSLQNQIKMYDAGTPYIFVNNDYTQGIEPEIKALQTNAVNNIASFSTELSKCWSEMFSVLGIDNVGVQKAERLTVDEVNSNNEQTNMIAENKIKSRNAALAYLNTKFGTDCHVEGVKATVSDNPVQSARGMFDYGSDPDDVQEPDVSAGGESNG